MVYKELDKPRARQASLTSSTTAGQAVCDQTHGINGKFKIRFKLWAKEYEDVSDEDEKNSKPCLPSSKAPEIYANMNDTVISGTSSCCVLFIKDLL